jgi:large subunit ribosomal protein L6
MSRVARKPVSLPAGVSVSNTNGRLQVKGPKGSVEVPLAAGVDVTVQNGVAQLHGGPGVAVALVGTARALLQNSVIGVSKGYEKKLELVGVGYRAAVEGGKLNLTLGFSHPVSYTPPEGVTITAPSQTEVLIAGADRQKVGQVAANIRAYRPPEPYKGKGVRFAGEKITLKEAKKA